MSITPFVVQLPQHTLDDLQNRLMRTRWSDEVSDDGWAYGTSEVYLRELVEHWASRFDWRRQEDAINRFAHFRADVNGFGIHFIHERGKGDRPLPLILTHGYPDSFLRFSRIIPARWTLRRDGRTRTPRRGYPGLLSSSEIGPRR